MSNSTANACKTSAMVICLLAFIGGIALSYESGRYGTSFNWIMAFSIWIGDFFVVLLLFSLGEIIEQLTVSNKNVAITKEQNEQIIQILVSLAETTQHEKNNNSIEDLPEL